MRDNLTLGCSSEVTDDQIWDALKLVGMDTSVGALDDKLETVIQADGSEFSAGEVCLSFSSSLNCILITFSGNYYV